MVGDVGHTLHDSPPVWCLLFNIQFSVCKINVLFFPARDKGLRWGEKKGRTCISKHEERSSNVIAYYFNSFMDKKAREGERTEEIQ